MSVQSLDGIGYVDPYTSLVSAVAIPSRDTQARSAVPETTVNVSARQRWIDLFDAIVNAPTLGKHTFAASDDFADVMRTWADARGDVRVVGHVDVTDGRRTRSIELRRGDVTIATATWPSESVAADTAWWRP